MVPGKLISKQFLFILYHTVVLQQAGGEGGGGRGEGGWGEKEKGGGGGGGLTVLASLQPNGGLVAQLPVQLSLVSYIFYRLQRGALV